MSSSDKKTCIQKRIIRRFRKNIWLSILILVAVGVVICVVLEISGFRVVESLGQTMRYLEDMFPEAFKGIVTVFGGIITYLFGRYLYEEYRKPKLEIVRVDPLSIPNVKFYRIVVKNTGKTAAENCTGGIHLFGTDIKGNNVDIKGSVCWSILGNPNIITINVEDEQSLEIYRIHRTQPKYWFFEVPTEKGWNFLRLGGVLPLSNFVNPAKLQIEIRITAKNAKPCKKKYSLRKQHNDIIMIA